MLPAVSRPIGGNQDFKYFWLVLVDWRTLQDLQESRVLAAALEAFEIRVPGAC